MPKPNDWLKDLELLAWRFSHLGFGPDLCGMTMIELAGLYRFLSRLADATR
jgi:hypothetical protein